MHQKSKKQRITKRKIGTLLLAILLAFSMACPFAARVFAYDGTETDTTGWIQTWTHFGSGGDVEWAIDPDGTLWLRPENGASSGTMARTESSTLPWKNLINNIQSVKIKQGTKIFTPDYTQGVFSGLNCNGVIDLRGLDLSQTRYLSGLFSGTKATTIILGEGLNSSQVQSLDNMFFDLDVVTLDLGDSFNTASLTSNINFFYNAKIDRIYIPEGFNNWPSDGSIFSPNYFRNNSIATGYWVKEDDPETRTMYLHTYIKTNDPKRLGWWTFEKTPGEYTVSFAAPDNTYSGSLAQMTGEATDSLALPKNTFAKNNYRFMHWDDGQGNTYADEETIPAHRYAAGSNITLTAVFEYDRSTVEINDNEFEITLKANEKMTLPELPAGTAYQIYEETPDGWVLVEQNNASGKIEPLQTSEASFKNRYQPGTTTAQFSGTKTLDMKAAAADAFSFSLYEGDTLIQTVDTLDGGFFQFDVIAYDDTMLGRHTYTIKENDPEDDTLDWDRHTETVIVDVVDNGDGTLSSTITYDEDGIVFSNMTRPGVLEVKKNAEGLTDANGDETYTFKITLNNESGMPLSEGDTIYWYKKDANGEIVKSNNLLGRLAAFFTGDETRAADGQESAIENSN